MSMRRFASVSLLLAGFTISACTAILVPDFDDDHVERCNNSEDCDALDDNRHVAQCVFGEGQPESSDKICAAAFNELNCHPESLSGEARFTELYEDVTKNSNKPAYGACNTDNQGKRGCAPAPAPDGCATGLQDFDGVCDDPDEHDTNPSINPSQVGGPDIAGQDVQDQLCRFYFCDESFVCDPSGSKPICKACDPDEAYGEGGCGTLYVEGAPSTVYTSLESANCEGEIDAEDAEFGEVNDPAI